MDKKELQTIGFGASLTLSSGYTLKNRLVKAALSECLADAGTNLPNPKHITLYKAWARGGAGMILSGNVMVDRTYLENPRCVALDKAVVNPRRFVFFQQWAQAITDEGACAIMQISHPGRQCPISVTRTPLSPTASPVFLKGLPKAVSRLALATPLALSQAQILATIQQYATTAWLAQEAGWSGVQIHAAHGYLISQFLSPRVNKRTDQWGGSLQNRMRFLLAVIKAVRATVKREFVVGIKINSADFQKGAFSEEDSLAVITALLQNYDDDAMRLDFIEISGGTYEDPALMGLKYVKQQADQKKRASTVAREAYFLDFAAKVQTQAKLFQQQQTTTPHNQSIPTRILVTGGFRTLDGINGALQSGDVDLVGLGRPLIVEPDLPNKFAAATVTRARDYTLELHWPAPLASFTGLKKTFGAVLENFWHVRQMHLIAANQPVDMTNSGWLQLQFFTVGFVRHYIFEPQRVSGPVKTLVLLLCIFCLLYLLF
jgi:2,4-dienoyl-CoA reductase-like NADH-dependent reductase (Old Yellow Enzyme family)